MKPGTRPRAGELLRQYELLEQEEREHVSGIIAALGKRNRKGLSTVDACPGFFIAGETTHISFTLFTGGFHI